AKHHRAEAQARDLEAGPAKLDEFHGRVLTDRPRQAGTAGAGGLKAIVPRSGKSALRTGAIGVGPVVTGKVEMEVVAMVAIAIRADHGGKLPAGPLVQLAQENRVDGIAG